MPLPLKGIRVLENTVAVVGPTCGKYLADLGAEVIRIAREWGRTAGHDKKSVLLNLSTEKGKEIFKQLAKKSDVILENYAPGAMERLGLDYDAIREVNPKIIYCSLSGYGRTGPDAYTRAFDNCIQGRSGLMSLTGPVGDPTHAAGSDGGGLTDCFTGLHGVVAILAALHYREKTGFGQHLDIAMLDSTVYFATANEVNISLSGENKIPKKSSAQENIEDFDGFF